MAMEKGLDEQLLAAYAGSVLSRREPHDSSTKANASLYAPPRYLDDNEQQLFSASWAKPDTRSHSDVSLTSSQREKEEEYKRALEEWDEGVRQLQMAFQLVLIPLLGKWFGRRWGYWCMYMHLLTYSIF